MLKHKNHAQALSADLSESAALLKWPLLLATWGVGVLALAPSVYMLEVYGRVVNARSVSTLVMLTLAVVFAFALLEFIEWARNRVLQRSVQALDGAWAERLFKLSVVGVSEMDTVNSSQLLQDWRLLCRFLASQAFQALLEAPVALLFLFAVFVISPVLGIFVLLGACLQVLIAALAERTTFDRLAAANDQARVAAKWADDVVRNAQVLDSMGIAARLERVWLERQNNSLMLQAKASEVSASASTSAKAVQNLVSSGVLGIGCWLLLENELNGGPAMMIVASILGARTMAPLLMLVSQWASVVQARQSWSRLQQHLGTKPISQDSLPLKRPEGVLTVEAVSAGVWSRGRLQSVLQGVDFRLAKGNVLAVVGPSASGKSTLGRLLVGILPAQQGAVRLDGYSIFDWDKSEVGKHLGYLPQEVCLLPGTIAENIARFGQVPREAVVQASELVGLHEAIAALPKGYDTVVDDDTPVLSGGERQRLALAAALFHKPAFVVLDEPNSSLDADGDRALSEAVRQLSEQGTTFVIMTHRTAILEVATHLMVLVNGRAQAFGKRDEVLANLAKAAAPGVGRA